MVEASPSSNSKRWEAVVRRLAWAVAGIGAAVLAGWAFDISWLKSVSPRWVAVKPNTALAMILLGLALWLEARRPASLKSRRSRLAVVLAVVVALFAGLTLIGSATGIDLGLDQFLFREAPGAQATTVPGRMAVATMIAFILAGISLAIGKRSNAGFLLAQILISTVMIIAFGYALYNLFGLRISSGLGAGTPMGFPTAVAFLLLGLGILAQRPDRGALGMLRSPGLEGAIARRLLPVAILLPPLIAALRIVGERVRAFGSGFGVVLVAITYIVIFSLFVGWSARSLGRTVEQRRRAEEDRHESEKMYRLILEQSADAIWLLDLATLRFVYVSPSIERLRGYTAGEVLAQSIEQALTPESFAFVLDVLPTRLEAFAAGDPSARIQVHELDQPCKDGRIIVTEVVTSILADAQGQAIQILGVSRDISERKRIQKEKAVSLEFMQIVNASPDIRHLIRAATDFFHEKSGFEAVGIRINEGEDYPYYETRGFPPEFVRLETSLCSLTPDGRVARDEQGRPLIECMCGNVIQGRFDAGKPFFTPHGSFWANDTTRLLATTTDADRKAKTRNRCNGEGYESVGLFPLRSGGRSFGLLQLNDHRSGRFTPDTIGLWERLADHLAVALAKFQAEAEILRLNTELEQRVRDRTAELQAANKELEAFSYSVSHDLRAPLRGIDGWSLALAEDYGHRLDQQGLDYLRRVRSETQRMGALIDDILQLARITRAEMQLETVDLTARARSVAERLRAALPGRAIRFEVRPGLKVRADPRLLDIALTNLLDNACKFTGPRSEARIEVGRAEDRGPGVFFVRDNGVGFDTAYAKNLFAPFQRMHKVSEFPGTGIGLATVQRIIHRHGGTIEAESKPGEGTCFYFVLEVPS